MTVHGDIAMHVHVSLPLGLSYSVKFCFCAWTKCKDVDTTYPQEEKMWPCRQTKTASVN